MKSITTLQTTRYSMRPKVEINFTDKAVMDIGRNRVFSQVWNRVVGQLWDRILHQLDKNFDDATPGRILGKPHQARIR